MTDLGTCDRCNDGTTPAEQVVTCWYGCQHRQCADCAAATRAEADEPSSVPTTER